MVSAALKLDQEDLALQAIAPRQDRTEIALCDVTVAYGTKSHSKKTILSNLNLEIAAGEFVVVLGETGCGKSTLLRLILGQEFPTSGTVIVDGRPLSRIDARCGYVPQKYSLFPDRTVLGNVMFGPENAYSGLFGRLRPSFYAFRRSLRSEAIRNLERMGLRTQDMNKYPHQLSGGMQQRVAIAQALMMRPPVMLMDEAFSALDPSTREKLQHQLYEAWSENRPTVIFVTHNTQEALLLGTRLILLGRQIDDAAPQSNVLLDIELPTSRIPLSRRPQSADFRDLQEHVKRTAYAHSSLYRGGEINTLIPEGDSE